MPQVPDKPVTVVIESVRIYPAALHWPMMEPTYTIVCKNGPPITGRVPLTRGQRLVNWLFSLIPPFV